MQQSGEHLEGGGFSGTVRAEETDYFAGLDRKVDLMNSLDIMVLSMEKSTRRRFKTTFTLGHLIRFTKLINLYRCGHREWILTYFLLFC